MKRLVLLIILFAAPALTQAQPAGVAYRLRGGLFAARPTVCKASAPVDQYYASDTDVMYICDVANHWKILATASTAGPGTVTTTGSPASGNITKFSGATSVTNATAGTDYVAPGGALGTPSSGTLTNATGLPEGGLSLTDITTNNFSITKHGFVPKGTNVGSFLRDDGTWAAAGGLPSGLTFASPDFTVATAAANQAVLSGSSTGNPIKLVATGSDTNIGITLTPKGNKDVTVLGAVRVTDFGNDGQMAFGFTSDSTTGIWFQPATALHLRYANTDRLDVSTGVKINGASVNMPDLGASSAATTGTVCWTTGTGLLNVDTTTTCLLSSARFKERSQPLQSSLNTILRLRPVSYFLKSAYNPTGLGEQVGLLAEDVAKVDSRLVSFESDGSPHAVRYQQLTAVLTQAMQELNAKFEAYKRTTDARLAAQQRTIKHLRHRH